MDTLTKLFGGIAYVKILRLFLFNPDAPFETKDVKKRAQVSPEVARREISRIYSLGLIKHKHFTKEVKKNTKKGAAVYKHKARGWILDQSFPFIEQLQNILLSGDSFQKDIVVNRFKNIGNLKLLIVSGIFVDEIERTDTRGRVDVLLVGERLRSPAIKNVFRSLEAEIGRELHYAVMKTDDFLYRRGIYDKFIRDVLDYPHEILVNKIGV